MTEPVPSYGGSVVVGQLRRVRLLHAAACRAAPRHRPDAVAVQRLPADAGGGDAAAADGRPPRQRRRRRRRSLRSTPAVSWVRWAGLADHPRSRRAQRVPAAGPGRGVLVRRRRRPRRPGGRSSRRWSCAAIWRTSATPARSSSIRRAPRTGSCRTRRSRPAGVPPDLIRISVGHRGSRRHHLGHRPGARPRRPRPEHDVTHRGHNPTARERLEIIRVDVVGRHRRHVGRSQPGQLLRRHLPAVVELLVRRRVVRQSERRRGLRPAGVPRRSPSCPGVPDLVDVFRRADDLPSVAEEVVAIPGIRTFWAQLGLYSPEAVDIVTAPGRDAVMNRCLKIEHARFRGGLHMAGFDTGVDLVPPPPRPVTADRSRPRVRISPSTGRR